MHKYDQKFATYLNRRLSDLDRSPSWLARRLRMAHTTVGRWSTGETRPADPETVKRVLVELGITDWMEQQRWLAAAGFGIPPPDDLNDRKDTPPPPGEPGERGFFRDVLSTWARDFFRLEDAPEDVRDSGAGMTLYLLSAAIDRMGTQRFLLLLLSVSLWALTAGLLLPVLTWPLAEEKVRLLALARYSLATLLVPFLVALVTRADDEETWALTSATQQLLLLGLKFTGALVGFHVFAAVGLGVALTWYYLGQPPLNTPARLFLALIPLFFGYVTARRIPTTRHKLFEGKLRFHPVDYWFLGTFLLLGPLIAFFLHTAYGFLADRTLGPVILLGVLVGLAFGEYKKQAPKAIRDPILIFILGVVLPLMVLVPALFLLANPVALRSAEWLTLLAFFLYLLSWTVLVATLWVRKKVRWTFTSLFATLGVLLAVVILVGIHREIGLGVSGLLLLGWFRWGRKGFQRYVLIHESHWLLLGLIGTSVAFWVRSNLPAWVHILLFLLPLAPLLHWAYQWDRSLAEEPS